MSGFVRFSDSGELLRLAAGSSGGDDVMVAVVGSGVMVVISAMNAAPNVHAPHAPVFAFLAVVVAAISAPLECHKTNSNQAVNHARVNKIKASAAD